MPPGPPKGSTVSQERRAAIAALRKYNMPPSLRDDFVTALSNFLPIGIENLIGLANGVLCEVEQETSAGETVQKVYKKPPDLKANIYLINRIMGIQAPEVSETTERLNAARANFIENQISFGVVKAQVEELVARAARAAMEAEMWPKQFVTEEQQQDMLQRLSRVVNDPLLMMTPEEFSEITVGRDPASALEELKARLGKDQAAIVAEVLADGEEAALPSGGSSDEEEEDEEECDE